MRLDIQHTFDSQCEKCKGRCVKDVTGKSQHTPTPETQKEMHQHLESVLRGKNKPAFANDEIPLILRAVNSHEALLEIAKAMLMFLQMGKDLQDRVFADKIREVVAQAEGK